MALPSFLGGRENVTGIHQVNVWFITSALAARIERTQHERGGLENINYVMLNIMSDLTRNGNFSYI